MLNKQMQQMRRRRVKNNLRYVAYWQSLKQLTKPDGSLLDDYVNKGIVYCNKIGLSSMEVFNTESDLIEGSYKVVCRKQTEDFDVSDRLLFLKDSDFTTNKVLSDDQILRVESIIDKTGRGERLNINCRSGVFVGKAPVEPRSLKNVIFKGAVQGNVINTAYYLNNTANRAVAYDLYHFRRDSSRDISLNSASWLGVTSNQMFIWFINGNTTQNNAECYNGFNRQREARFDIQLGSGRWKGGPFHGNIMWFINNQIGMAVAYDSNTRQRVTSKDISLGSGIWAGGFTDGFNIFFINQSFNRAVGYSPVTLQTDRNKNINLGSGTWTGGLSNNDELWVIDNNSGFARSYDANTLLRLSHLDKNLPTGNYVGGCFIRQIVSDFDFSNINNKIDLYKTGNFNLDIIQSGQDNPWIFDDANKRVPILVTLDADLSRPSIKYNDQTHIMNPSNQAESQGFYLWYTDDIPIDVNKIDIVL